MLFLEGVSKSYDSGRTYAVSGVDLGVEEGELLVLLGESGCGKTTTLKMINRLVEPTEGTVRVGGRDTRDVDPVSLRRRIGYVFQGIGLFPHLTVGENVAVVPNLLGWEQEDVNRRVRELLDLLRLPAQAFLERRPAELSGGQQQRVGLARALAARPTIMLMDEPFGALDPITRDGLRDEFTRIHRELGLTTVLVTHDMTEALLLADRIAVMSEGRILRVDAPRGLVNDPRDPYVRELMDMPRRQADRLETLMRGSGDEG